MAHHKHREFALLFSFIQALNGLMSTHTRKAIFFVQFTDSNAHLIPEHPHTHTQKQCFTHYPGVP